MVDEWGTQMRKCTSHKMSNFSHACATSLFAINLFVTFLLSITRRGRPAEENRGLDFCSVLRKGISVYNYEALYLR